MDNKINGEQYFKETNILCFGLGFQNVGNSYSVNWRKIIFPIIHFKDVYYVVKLF